MGSDQCIDKRRRLFSMSQTNGGSTEHSSLVELQHHELSTEQQQGVTVNYQIKSGGTHANLSIDYVMVKKTQ